MPQTPKSVAPAARTGTGDYVGAVADGLGQVKTRKTAKEQLKFAEFVARISPENRHEEIDWGKPVGKELR